MKSKRRHPALNAALRLMYAYRWTVGFYWLIYICTYVIIGILVNSPAVFGDAVDAQGMWEGSSNSPKIFLMVIGILMTPMSLAGFVSNGVTRKHFICGAGILSVVLSAISAVIMTIGYPIEQWIYERLDWPHELNNPHLFTDTTQVWAIFAEYFFLFAAYFGTGWLIGGLFYRFNWKLALFLCVFALLPAMAMEIVLAADWAGQLLQTVFETERPAMGVVLSLALIVTALTFGAAYLLLRHVTIKRKAISS